MKKTTKLVSMLLAIAMLITLIPANLVFATTEVWDGTMATSFSQGGTGTEKTMEQFKSGVVAYLLGDGCGQNLVTDSYPVLDDQKVYATKRDHGFVDKVSNSFLENISSYDEYGKCKTYENVEITVPKLNADKFYEITNVSEYSWVIFNVANGDTSLNVKLMNDINLTGLNPIQIGSDTNNYIGTFDGNGKTVTIDVKDAKTEGMAVFHTLGAGAIVRNLKVVGSISSSEKFAGGITGFVRGNSTIENCITDVAFDFTPGGDATFGGIVGVINGGTLKIYNCGVLGSFTSSSQTAVTGIGGMVGWGSGKTWITNSYVAATLANATENACDNFSRNGGIITNCYYNNQFAQSTQGTQKTDKQFVNGEVAYLLGDAWGQKIGKDTMPTYHVEDKVYASKCDHGFIAKVSNSFLENISSYDEYGKCTICGNDKITVPHLNVDNFYEITNVSEYLWVACNVANGNTSAKVKLMNNIDLTKSNLIQIGSDTNNYIGTFDGNGKTVTIKVENATTEKMALFHTLGKGANIKNLKVAGSISSSKNFIGGIAGYVTDDSTIENCIVDVDFDYTPGGQVVMGGIIGQVNDGLTTINNCAVLGSFTSAGSELFGIAGMVGWRNSNVTITNSYVASTLVNVKATDNENFSRNGGTITNCYYKNQFSQTTQGTQKTTDQFASGEVAYLLGDGWGQQIETVPLDPLPVLGGAKVYLDGTDYTNTTPASVVISQGGTTVTANTTTASVLVLASYNRNRLLEMKTYNISSETTKTIANEIDLSGATEVKAFLWESLGNIKPLCDGAKHKIGTSVEISEDGKTVTANTTSACVLVLASYSNNKLLDIKTHDILAAETKTIANQLNLSGATEIKAFMWENLGNMKSLCDFDAKALQQ